MEKKEMVKQLGDKLTEFNVLKKEAIDLNSIESENTLHEKLNFRKEAMNQLANRDN